MSARSIVTVLLAVGLAAAPASAAVSRDRWLHAATQELTRSTKREGLSAAEWRMAMTALHRLAEAGVPAAHAGEMVATALSRTHRSQELDTLLRQVEWARSRGASSHELVNLIHDLARSGVDVSGITVAIEAVGRLAEEGYIDAETRRGVAVHALHAHGGGFRDERLLDVIHDETRRVTVEERRERHERSPAGRGPSHEKGPEWKADDGAGPGRADPNPGRKDEKDKNKDNGKDKDKNDGKGPSGNPGRGGQ